MTFRRVLTADGPDGRSRVASDESVEVIHRPATGVTIADLWTVEPNAPVPHVGDLPGEPSMALPPGRVRVFHMIVPAHTTIDQGTGGLVFSDERPGFHMTDTVDIDTCLEGELTLELDDETVTLRPGDTIVLHGQNHRWSNRGAVPARISITLVGALRQL